MKKVLSAMSGIIFAVFCIAILGLLMSFTLGALRKLFPDSFVNQMWGLVLFDIAAMVWALAFVFKSHSVGQYAAAGIGFITGFAGTLLMVTFEIMTSGQQFVQVGDLGRWAVYGFIIVTAVHAALVYFHHAAAPDIHEKINVGIARGEITTEAIRQATNQLEIEKAMLAQTIHTSIVDQVKRDLNIPILADPNMPIIPAEQQPYTVPYPVQQPQPAQDEQKKNKSWFEKFKNTLTPTQKKAAMKLNEQIVVDVPKLKKQNRAVNALDVALAESINPMAAPYRACPKCDDDVPLTASHCAVCGTEMPALPPAQEDKPTEGNFPEGKEAKDV